MTKFCAKCLNSGLGCSQIVCSILCKSIKKDYVIYEQSLMRSAIIDACIVEIALITKH